jgi:hypothetical protein
VVAKGVLAMGGKPAERAQGPVYRLLVSGSFAEYFADWLIDAAAEYRYH